MKDLAKIRRAIDFREIALASLAIIAVVATEPGSLLWKLAGVLIIVSISLRVYLNSLGWRGAKGVDGYLFQQLTKDIIEAFGNDVQYIESVLKALDETHDEILDMRLRKKLRRLSHEGMAIKKSKSNAISRGEAFRKSRSEED